MIFFALLFISILIPLPQAWASEGIGSFMMLGGGGTNESASTTIETDEFSGAATYSIKIPVPPGRGAVTPTINLNYNSHRRNPNGWVGYGWELDLGSIARIPAPVDNQRYDGILNYDSNTGFEVRLGGQAERLKLIQTKVNPDDYGWMQGPDPSVQYDLYQAEVESAFTWYIHSFRGKDPSHLEDLGWIGVDKSGTHYYFGTSQSSQVSTPDENDFNKYKLQRWLLTQVIDPNGNRLEIFHDSRKLPDRLQYQDMTIRFEKGAPGYPYFPSFRDEMLTDDQMGIVLNRAVVSQRDAKGIANRLMAVRFSYQLSPSRQVHQLVSVQQFGETDNAKLPAVQFDHFDDDNFSLAESSYDRSAKYGNNDGLINDSAVFADMNGDGLMDQVLANDDGSFTTRYNNGNDFVYVQGRSHWTEPFLCKNNDSDGSCQGKLNGFRKGHQWLFLMDINGDSLPDRFAREIIRGGSCPSECANFVIALNNGFGWESKVVRWRDPYEGNWAGTSDQEKGFVDMNGDGLVDRIVGDEIKVGKTKQKGFWIYYNTGAGFKQSGVFAEDPIAQSDPGHSGTAKIYAVDGDDTFTFIRDMNGDGLSDRVWKTTYHENGVEVGKGVEIALNTNGTGWARRKIDPNTNFSLIDGIDNLAILDPSEDQDSRGVNNKRHDWLDINGDGLLDRVEGDGNQGIFRVYVYRGIQKKGQAARLSPATVLNDPIKILGKNRDGSGIITDREKEDQFAFFQDFNGDSLPDRLGWTGGRYLFYPLRTNPVTFSDSPAWWVDSQVSQPIGALKGISDGRGGRTALEYHPSTWPERKNFPNHRFIPFNMNLVHKIYSEDVQLSQAGGPFQSLPETKRHPGMRWTTYRFRGGNFYVRYALKTLDNILDDSVRRTHFSRFNGFQEVQKSVIRWSQETWSPYTTITHYHQAIGDVDAGLKDSSGIPDLKAYRHFALSGKPYLQTVYEGGAPVVEQTTSWSLNEKQGSTYECTGLCFPKLLKTHKTVHESGGAPRLSEVFYDYDPLGNIKYEAYGDGKGNISLWKETTYYPSSSFQPFHQIRDRPKSQSKKDFNRTYRWKEFFYDSRGNPVEERLYADGGGQRFLSVKRTFRPDGNVASITDTNGVFKNLDYDPQGIFPEKETISLPNGQSLTTTRTFNRLNGEMIAEISPHKVGKVVDFDDFGRPIKESVRNTQGNLTTTRTYDYTYLQATVDGWSTTLLQTQIWEPQPGHNVVIPKEVSFSDGSGTTLQKCILSERGDYRIIQSRRRNAGREELQTEPVFGGCNFQSTLSGRATRTKKDLMGRIVSVELPSGDADSPVGSVSIGYKTDGAGHVIKTITNQKGQVTVENYDGNERLVSLKDQAGGHIEYVYNPVGDLEQVIGQGKLLTKIYYDLLGRKYQMDDADMGTWTYDYDSLGRLETQEDNKRQTTKFYYDNLSRITKREFFNGQGQKEKYETYTYDQGNGVHDVRGGELFQVEEFDAQGNSSRATRFGYDPDYRREARITRIISGAGAFRQDIFYDYLGRVTETVYPAGRKVFYDYMIPGALGRVCGDAPCNAGGEAYYSVDPASGYDVYGALLKESLGNGVASEYSYYPLSHRLQEKKTFRGGEIYAKRAFTHDALSNIASLADPLNLKGSGAIDSTSYDSLNRLTGYKQSGASVTLDYDIQGNLKKNTASYGNDLYEYNSPRPHAVTKIGSEAFDYDDNGNMTKDPYREMTYNTQNQLAKVKMVSGAEVEYDYDYTGTRVSKKVTRKDPLQRIFQTTTHYLGDAIELRGEQVILHIHANGRRIASRTLGKIADAMAAGSSLVDRGIDPVLNPSVFVPWLLIFFVLFLLGSLRPVPQRIPVWAHAMRAPPYRILRILREIYLTWRTYRETLQESLILFHERRWAKGFVVFLLTLFVFQSSTAAWAGETGQLKPTENDADYFYYEHGDHLGSSHILTEGKTKAKHSGIIYQRGDLLQRFEYAPFGQEIHVLNPNLKFDPSYTGQTYDMETGLYYYKSRYYNPLLARFTQPDTVVPDAKDLQSYNRYSYVNNNPLKYVDPSGHFFFLFAIAAFAGALIGTAAAFAVVTALALTGIAAAVVGGLIGGFLGGLVSGAITGGLKGALWGMLFGTLAGAAGGAAGFGLSQAIGKVGAFAVMGGIGGTVSVATGGWKGLVAFGAGLVGGYLGSKVGTSIGQKISASKAGDELTLHHKPGKAQFDYSSNEARPQPQLADSTNPSDTLPDAGTGYGLEGGGNNSGVATPQPGQSVGVALKVDATSNLFARSFGAVAGIETAQLGAELMSFGAKMLPLGGYGTAAGIFLIGVGAGMTAFGGYVTYQAAIPNSRIFPPLKVGP